MTSKTRKVHVRPQRRNCHFYVTLPGSMRLYLVILVPFTYFLVHSTTRDLDFEGTLSSLANLWCCGQRQPVSLQRIKCRTWQYSTAQCNLSLSNYFGFMDQVQSIPNQSQIPRNGHPSGNFPPLDPEIPKIRTDLGLILGLQIPKIADSHI
jgi:hypothetical protein